jgi:hypothetical protein
MDADVDLLLIAVYCTARLPASSTAAQTDTIAYIIA